MKRLAKSLAAFLLLLCCAGGWFAPQALSTAGISTFYIEQVYLNAPQADVFVYALNADGESLSPAMVTAAGVDVTLGDKKLRTGTVTQAAEPICYLFVLDDSSRTVSAEAFLAFKHAVLDTARAKGPQDQLLLYTTAGGVTRVLDESSTAPDVAAALTRLEQKDEASDLTGALTQIAADVNTSFQSLAPRKAVFACTSTMALMSDTAALAGLVSDTVAKNLNMALYTFTSADGAGRIAALDTLTNGRIIPCKADEIRDAVNERRNYLAKALEIKAVVGTAQAGERMETLAVSVPSLGSAVSLSTTVYMGHILATPQVTSVTVKDRTHLAITFNQAVDNAQGIGAYVVRSQDAWGWQVRVKKVEVSKDGRSALLTTEKMYEGNYAIRLKGVTSRLSSANRSAKEETGFAVSGWKRDRAFYLARFRLPAVILAVLLGILVARGRLQKRADRSAEAAAEAEHLLSSADAMVPALPKRWLTLLVRRRGTVAEERVSAMVESSLIVGSDKTCCDLCIEDTRIRPQHCIFSVEGDEVFVRALEKTGAVYCNRSRLADAHRLHNNDVIQIGGTRIQVVL